METRTKEFMIVIPLEIIRTTHNDQDLGRKIRELSYDESFLAKKDLEFSNEWILSRVFNEKDKENF
jgi:hypothetical protein